MSQFNYSNAQNWNRRSYQEQLQGQRSQKQYQTPTSNPPMTSNSYPEVRKIDRIDSFDTSLSSHDHQSSISLGSPFDAGQPTPSDPISEPSFLTAHDEDLFWHSFHEGSQNWNDPDMNLHVTNNIYNLQPHSIGLNSNHTHLPSPQLTNTSTPEAIGHSKNNSQSSAVFASPLSSPHQFQRPIDAMTISHRDSNVLSIPNQTIGRPANPRIDISHHSRGDSPARSESRIGKKRSSSNLSQGEHFPDVEEDSQSTMLMPPLNRADPDYDDDEEHRSGIDPAHRGTEQITSLKEMTAKQETDGKVVEISDWLQNTSLDPSSARYARGHVRQDLRLRSRSTGAQARSGQKPILKTIKRPGPNLLIDEVSDYYYSSDEESNEELAPEDHPPAPLLDKIPDEENPPDVVDPLPNDYWRPLIWKDSYPVLPPDNGKRYQPLTSAAAMQKFELHARDFDTLSRRATCGTIQTGRRGSDGDQDTFLLDGKVRHFPVSTRERLLARGLNLKEDFKAKAKEAKSSLRRSNSRTRQNEMDGTSKLEKVQSPELIDDRRQSESQPSPRRPSVPSFSSKTKSPSITAAIASAGGNLAAVGASNATLSIDTNSQFQQVETETKPRKSFLRRLSTGNANKSPRSSAGLRNMLAQEGGMPFTGMAARESDMNPSASPIQYEVPFAQDFQPALSSAIKMSLSPQPANVMPNTDGFAIQIRELNPMLEDYLVERMAHDQERRYKRLVKNKVDHARDCEADKCQSRPLCPASGGVAELLPPRSSGRDVQGHFMIPNNADSDNEEPFDGLVTAAAFPEGIPLPPTKKLPAKFECSLCFQVRTFNKPSDWTKHVHEDVQPFTCTFKDCVDPKPFKRKADWVRHENERHRQLEWWKCNINDCTHVCFRKDNFVQHLVREHKRNEPKVKGKVATNGKGKVRGTAGAFNQEELEFWRLVDTCHHEATRDVRLEPCKFCGNICSSWKKLSVHVAKHMEQIAMPVLELAEKRNVTKDTIISPIEPLPTRQSDYLNTGHSIGDSNSRLSPLTPSIGISYSNSSAEHSPHSSHTQPFMAYAYQPVGHLNGGLTPRVIHSNNMENFQSFQSSMGDTGFDTTQGFEQPVYNVYQNGQTILYSSGHSLSYPIPGQMSSNMTMSSTFGNIPTYNDGTQYLSSPEQQYPSYQNNGMMTPEHVAMQMQTPVTSHPMNGVEYTYQQQQQGWQS